MNENEMFQEDKIERITEEYYGLDHELINLEDDNFVNEQPFDAEKIRIQQEMLSVKYMYELMSSNHLELSPDFQRYSVWKDNKRRSLLIESLMLKIPIPAFYFYEKSDTSLIVIDGQQRLITIRDFIDNKYKLTGLEYLYNECNGKYFKDLDIKYTTRIFRTQLAVNTLDERSPSEVIYDIFRRINTGGVPLKPQEIRNAIAKNKVRTFLKKLSKSNEFISATRGRIKDDRMDAQELVVRFIALLDAYNFEKENFNYLYSDLVTMLDMTITKLNNSSDRELERYQEIFLYAMKKVKELLGEYSFTKVYMHDDDTVYKKSDVINKSLFSSFSVILSNEKYRNLDLSKYSECALRDLAYELENPEFMNSITVGTGDRRRIHENFYFTNMIIRSILNEN